MAADEGRSFDVRVWGVSAYAGKRSTTYTVRWRVHGRRFRQTFPTKKLAESFRSTLVVAARQGEPFDRGTGQVSRTSAEPQPTATWLDHAVAFVDMKWPHASPQHRRGIADGLMTATVAALPTTGGPPAKVVRAALSGWAFNTVARGGRPLNEVTPPPVWADAIAWSRGKSLSLDDLATPTTLRRVMDALGRNLEGRASSASTIARKRSALYSALDYAVEIDALPTNPMDRINWKIPTNTDAVDRRVVVNPRQARALLEAVRQAYPSLEAYFACIYFAALRPAEVLHLQVSELELPADDGWGTLHLTGSTQNAGSAWTDTGTAAQDRQLKHRATGASRHVPASPELVSALRQHVAQFPPGEAGRLFVTRTGRAGTPLVPPYDKPQSMGIVYRVWDQARRAVFSDAEYASPLARRPYDLSHAAVSLWLNAGVPATQVAEWAGHSVNVLLRVYASCIVGQSGRGGPPTRPSGPQRERVGAVEESNGQS